MCTGEPSTRPVILYSQMASISACCCAAISCIKIKNLGTRCVRACNSLSQLFLLRLQKNTAVSGGTLYAVQYLYLYKQQGNSFHLHMAVENTSMPKHQRQQSSTCMQRVQAAATTVTFEDFLALCGLLFPFISWVFALASAQPTQSFRGLP